MVRQNVWRTPLFPQSAPLELLDVLNQGVKSRISGGHET
jgi:hypothetical protein